MKEIVILNNIFIGINVQRIIFISPIFISLFVVSMTHFFFKNISIPMAIISFIGVFILFIIIIGLMLILFEFINPGFLEYIEGLLSKNEK